MTQSPLGLHCRVKCIKYGPYFKHFNKQAYFFRLFPFLLSFFHVFIYVIVPLFSFFLHLSKANAFQCLSHTTDHTEGLFCYFFEQSLFCWHTDPSVGIQHLCCTALILKMRLIPWLSCRRKKEREEEGKKSKIGFSNWQESDVMFMAMAMMWGCPRTGVSC